MTAVGGNRLCPSSNARSVTIHSQINTNQSAVQNVNERYEGHAVSRGLLKNDPGRTAVSP